jgi:hypothetical protein
MMQDCPLRGLKEQKSCWWAARQTATMWKKAQKFLNIATCWKYQVSTCIEQEWGISGQICRGQFFWGLGRFFLREELQVPKDSHFERL